jgi:uncharacterized protein
MNISEKLLAVAKNECQQLLGGHTGILAVVISSGDGFDIASAVTKSLVPARIAAMASSIAAIGSVVSQEVFLGNSRSITVNTEKGFTYITQIELGSHACALNVVADSSAVLAQIIYQCSEIGKRLRNT